MLSAATERRHRTLSALARGSYTSLPRWPGAGAAEELAERPASWTPRPRPSTTPAREPPCKAHQVYGCVVCRGLLNNSPPRRRPSPPRVTTPAAAAPRLNRAIVRATFAKVDQNGDGRVQLHELARSVAENDALAQLLGLPPGAGSARRVEGLFASLDSNADSDVSFEEFAVHLERLVRAAAPAGGRPRREGSSGGGTGFGGLDADGDGMLSRDEFRQGLFEEGVPPSPRRPQPPPLPQEQTGFGDVAQQSAEASADVAALKAELAELRAGQAAPPAPAPRRVSWQPEPEPEPEQHQLLQQQQRRHSQELQGLRTELASLRARPSPPPVPAAATGNADADAAASQEIAGLRSEIEAMRAAAQASQARARSPSPPREDSREVAALKAQIAALESRPPAAAPSAQPLQALRTEITSQASSQAAAGHADAADLLFQVLDGNRDGMVSAAEFEGRAHRAEAEAREMERTLLEARLEAAQLGEVVEKLRAERAAEVEAAALSAASAAAAAEREAARQRVETAELSLQQTKAAAEAAMAAADEKSALSASAQSQAMAEAASLVTNAQAALAKERQRMLEALTAERERRAAVEAEYAKRVETVETERARDRSELVEAQEVSAEAQMASEHAQQAAARAGRTAAHEANLRQDLERKNAALQRTATKQQERLLQQLHEGRAETARLSLESERSERRWRNDEAVMRSRIESERKKTAEAARAAQLAEQAAATAVAERGAAVAQASEKLQASEEAMASERRRRSTGMVPKQHAEQAVQAASYAQEKALETERELQLERQRRSEAEAAASSLRTQAMRLQIEEGRAAAAAEDATSRLSALESRVLAHRREDEQARNESAAAARAERDARLAVERKAKAQLTEQADEMRAMWRVVEEERQRRASAERASDGVVASLEGTSPLELLGGAIFGEGGKALSRQQFRQALAAGGLMLPPTAVAAAASRR